MEVRPIGERRAAAKEQASHYYVERRKQVLKAAADVFRSKGLAASSIGDVAEAANVNRATVYYYVKSKEELFEAVVLDALENNVELAERLHDSDDSPKEKLEMLVVGLLRSYAEFYPHMYVFIQENVHASARQGDGVDIPNLQHRFNEAFTGIIHQGTDAGIFRSDLSPRVAAYGVLGMINWTHRWFDPKGLLTADQLSGQFLALICDGLLSRSETKPGQLER